MMGIHTFNKLYRTVVSESRRLVRVSRDRYDGILNFEAEASKKESYFTRLCAADFWKHV